MSNIVFCLMGPTASGKTELACELAERFLLEIISVDSAMIYRDMNIGTAKPNEKILARAPHGLINIIDPPASYSAARFCEDVSLLSQRIRGQGKIPLLVGGSMMYFRALQSGLSVLPEADEALRAQLLQEAREHGWEHMHQKLKCVDAVTAARVHPNDAQRIQRALEIHHVMQQPWSDLLKKTKGASSDHFINLSLIPTERSWLHQRITLRFEQMLEQGFVDEVEGLLQKWQVTLEHPSMRCVGYRQVLLYLQGAYDHTCLIEKGTAATRQLAKRQLTWLRHWPDAHVFAAESSESRSEIMAFVQKVLDNLT
jgi:tRNA dimethylallyltransferase